jgi:hypothetical protein
VFALFWFWITFYLELIAFRNQVCFIYVILWAAGAGELNQKYDYADDYVTNNCPLIGSRPTDSEIPISHCAN